MRVACIAAILALAVCAVSPMLAQRVPAGPVPLDCNRACLEGLINQYLDASCGAIACSTWTAQWLRSN
jgi:hypothetical protein